MRAKSVLVKRWHESNMHVLWNGLRIFNEGKKNVGKFWKKNIFIKHFFGFPHHILGLALKIYVIFVVHIWRIWKWIAKISSIFRLNALFNILHRIYMVCHKFSCWPSKITGFFMRFLALNSQRKPPDGAIPVCVKYLNTKIIFGTFTSMIVNGVKNEENSRDLAGNNWWFHIFKSFILQTQNTFRRNFIIIISICRCCFFRLIKKYSNQ